MTSAFEYPPLDPSDPRAFRVLKLLPSSNEKDPIRCELRNRTLDENIKYEALSYAWGQVAPSCPVIINDEAVVNVTESCVDALRSLRGRSHRRTLWVDAICINQDDNDTSRREKNHQVKCMFEIYKNAQCVLIWLGPEESGTARTLKILKLLAFLNAEDDSLLLTTSPEKLIFYSIFKIKSIVARKLANRMRTSALFSMPWLC
jgi:hypothetical protein